MKAFIHQERADIRRHAARPSAARPDGEAVTALIAMPGQEADFIVPDDAATPLLARRTAGRPLAERRFALQILGDDRAIAATYVAVERVASRTGAFA